MPRRTTTKTKPVEVEPEELEDEIDDLDEDEVDEEPEPAPVRKARTKKAVVKKVVVEEDDDDEDELEDEEDEKPAKAKRQPPKRAPIEFGTAWLAGLVNDKLDTEHTAYSLRNLIRKMVKEDLFDREVGTDRSRYEFTGPKDKNALAIVKYVQSVKDKPKPDRSDNLAKARAARKANLEAKKNAAVEEDDEIEELDD